MPKISIIMPVFNAKKYINESIASVTCQNHNNRDFSVLMSVYLKENSQYLKDSIDSIFNNTVVPSELIIIEDGVLTDDLYLILDKYENIFPSITRVPLKKNVGLGKALNIGLSHCSNEWVFRMDTDDICLTDRFEKQVKFLKENPEVDILSGQVIEFDTTIDNITGNKRVPLAHKDIIQFSKTRNPFNHMAVAYKKSVIESVEGYKHHAYMEDYNLWLRVLAAGYIGANLEDNLVLVRAGEEMIKRRSGKVYLKSEWQLFKMKRSLNYQGTVPAISTLIARSIPRLLPNKFLTRIYSILRKV